MIAPGRWWRVRRILSRLLLVIAACVLLQGIGNAYVAVVLVDPGTFADRIEAARQNEDVRQFVAALIVERLVERAAPDVVAARPLIEQVVAAALATPALKSVARIAAVQLHRTLFDPAGRSLVLDLADAGVVAEGALRAYAPQLASGFPAELSASFRLLSERGLPPEITAIVEQAPRLAVSQTAAALLLLALTVWLADDRRRALGRVGGALIAVALVLALALLAGRRVLTALIGDEIEARAAGAAWDIFLGPLWHWLLLLAGLGCLLVAAAITLRAPVDLAAWYRRAVSIVTARPATAWGRVGRAGLALLLGVGIVLDPALLLRLASLALGLPLAIWGASELLWLLAGAQPRATGADAPAHHRYGRLVIGTVTAVAVVAIALMGGLALRTVSAATGRAPDEIVTCNGAPALCDRTLDQVALPATHNSMSIAGWYQPAQGPAIVAQLDAGIRGLLVDTHYGVPDGQLVRTDLSGIAQNREALVAQYGEETVAAAERLAGRLGYDLSGAGRQPYLCHGFCELGATPFASVLAEIRRWLERHPDEVLVMDIEDYITPEDTARVFAESGLDRLVYTHPAGAPWPTLREMIASGHRVLVMAEKQGGGAAHPWYHSAYTDLLQETPFAFATPQEFSCAPNRGYPDSPLFLINHWISTSPPRVSDAMIVNARDMLLARARQCQRERGHIPNLVAINFAERGALLDVVDQLNGLPPRGEP